MKEADASIRWINGCAAIAEFAAVCHQLELTPTAVSRMVFKTYGLDIDVAGMVVTRFKPVMHAPCQQGGFAEFP